MNQWACVVCTRGKVEYEIVGTMKIGCRIQVLSQYKEQVCHVRYSFESHLPVVVGFGVTMCSAAPDLASLLR
jgi:hypothetical protein